MRILRLFLIPVAFLTLLFISSSLSPLYAAGQCIDYSKPLDPGQGACDNANTLSICVSGPSTYNDITCPTGCEGADGSAHCKVQNQCSGGYNPGYKTCKNTTTISSCEQPDPTKDAAWVDSSCSEGCEGSPGSAVCKGTVAAAADCTVTVGKDGPVNPPVKMSAGQYKCIQNEVVNCISTGDNIGRTDCGSKTCTETGSAAECKDAAAAGEEVPDVPNYGQFIPKPAENCGIPIEDTIPPATQADATDSRHACCYSWMADRIRIPDSANFADGVPGVDKLMGAIIAALNGVIDNFPFFINPFGALDKIPVPTVGKIKSWLLSTPACVAGFPSGDVNKPGCVCTRNIGAGSYDADKICNTITDDEEKKQCRLCVGFNPGSEQLYKFDGVWTSLGCINVSQNGFIQSLISLGVQIGGGTALLCIMYAAFLLQTSQGSPERIKRARDLMTSCITGLLLILFAVFILRVIGYDILRIPGLG